MKGKPRGKILRTLGHRALTQHKQAEPSSSRQNPEAQGRTQKHKAEPSSTRQNPAAQGRTQQQQQQKQQQQQQQQAEPRSSRQNLGAAGRTQKHKAESSTSRQDPPQAGKTSTSVQNPEPSSSRQQQAAVGSSRHQQAEHSNSRQNPAAARRTEHKQADSSRHRFSRGRNHTEPKYDKFQWARLSPNYWQWHHHKDCNQYHTGLSRIMSTIHCPQRWNSIQINNSQSNKEKNYQNLNETLRARRCDTTSGHLVRRKPSGSSSEAIQQQFGSSQRQQLSNSQQLSSSLTVVAKYSWTYRSHWQESSCKKKKFPPNWTQQKLRLPKA